MITFAADEHIAELARHVREFVDRRVIPQETELIAAMDAEVGPGRPFADAVRRVREEARARGLWNLHAPRGLGGAGLSHAAYALACEETGRSLIAPMAFNAQAPNSRKRAHPGHARHARADRALADSAARGRDPHLLRDDRAGGRRLGPHPDPDHRPPRGR